ncbi:MAG TPA: LysM peptidoglycan-binding domain-containing protein [Candidatus Binataceae bacterium]|nr:LysM peptidoglycan-binding domain-containing protein [Candidatus Binataceae bacterium]
MDSIAINSGRALLPGRLLATAAATMLALLVCRLPANALSEESIEPSPTTHTTSHATTARDESVEAAPLPPRATFPYAIREGDTLGAIANQFGLAVTDLTRINHVTEETDLEVGRVLRIPNPAVAHERELTAEIARLQRALQDATYGAQAADQRLAAARTRTNELETFVGQTGHALRLLTWWRAAAYISGALGLLAVGAMLLALIEWWLLRSRFRAVAEANESMRRLDYRYRTALAKVELRLQELYGRRRRGLHDGQERPKLAEEAEIERLNRELRMVLERQLEQLGPPGAIARRARWRLRIAGIGSPVEARSLRR